MTFMQVTAVQVLVSAAVGCWTADRLRLAIKYCDDYIQRYARQFTKLMPILIATLSLVDWIGYGPSRELLRGLILAGIAWLVCTISVLVKMNFGGVWQIIGGSDGL